MSRTLHELATHLQESIIRQQEDAHNSSNLNISKYNNLKLRMDSVIHYPHVIIEIGISRAVYNIKEGTKAEGSLGPDERYVRKWLGNSTVIYDLTELYEALHELVDAKNTGEEDEDAKLMSQEAEADEVKVDAPKTKKRKGSGYVTMEEVLEQQLRGDNAIEMEIEGGTVEESKEYTKRNNYSLESVNNIKQNLKSSFKSLKRFYKK